MLSFFKRAAIAVLSVSAISSAVQAAMIGINFSSTGNALSSTTSAGLVAQTNWNNMTGNSGTKAAGSLVDSSGATLASTTLSFSSNYLSGSGITGAGFSAGGNKSMYTAYISGDGGGNSPPTLTFTNIPYSNYDVYVYVGADSVDRFGSVALSTTGTGAVDASKYYYHAMNTGSAFVKATMTATAASGANYTPWNANYMYFTGNTASQLKIQYASESPQKYGSGIYGVQIVQTPEPATLCLLGLGGVIVLRRRRA